MGEATRWPHGGAVEAVEDAEGRAARKAYWDGWYEENRERIAAKRARRWREDPAYRRAENARRRQQRRAAADRRAPKPVAAPWCTAEVAVGDRSERAYTLGYVARQLGCSEALLRQWRMRGQLPPSPYRSGRRHLYTEAMIAAIRAARDARVHVRCGRRVVGEDATMGAEIAAAWQKVLFVG